MVTDLGPGRLCAELHFGFTSRQQINRAESGQVSYFQKGTDARLAEGTMALKDLERLTGELRELAQLLRQETRTQARWIILQRVQTIMAVIEKGFKE